MAALTLRPLDVSGNLVSPTSTGHRLLLSALLDALLLGVLLPLLSVGEVLLTYLRH